MNERIRELIVRLVPDAFMTYKGYLYHSSDPKVLEHSDPEPLYTRQELEKFAELIVRECVGIVAKRKDEAIDDGCNVDEAMSMAEMDLEEHFGVKE